MNESSGVEITVGIITYNRPEFLKEAVQSVLQQTFIGFELIISNDYQDDNVTFDSLGIKNDSRIKIINQERNLGEVNNMNYLLRVARGDWFVWLADDDLLHPEFLTLAYRKILENRESSIVGIFSNYSAGSSPDGIFPVNLRSNASNWQSYDASRFLMDYTLQKNKLIGCYGVMHVGTLRKIGGMPLLGNSFGPDSDTLIPILLAEYGRLCWLDEKLVFLRTHENSLSCKSTDFSAYTSAESDFLECLKRVCDSKAVSAQSDLVVANMIRWFAVNEWAVLSREPSRSVYEVSRIFIKYQLNVNLSRLSVQHKILHILFVLRLLVTFSLAGMFKKFCDTFGVTFDAAVRRS